MPALPPPPPPRISILLPNFNNGRESSRTGRDDLLGALLQSLWDTLHSDPTPLEMIAYDDGSTDDSLATLRAWAGRSWPDGRPFLELIEAEHSGYLSRVANVLSRRARGEFLVRMDGDTACLTPNWAAALCKFFDEAPPEVGIVGPKQLRPDGKIHAYGDFILHPNGYCHVASGMERQAVRFPMEVDHIMGCFYCCRKAVYEDVGGYDERFLRGQTEDLGLMARLRGWRAVAVPHIEFGHFHGMREDRATEADSTEGVLKTLQVFENKWGFSRLAPDLDEVKRRYAGTPLLWKREFFEEPAAHPAPAPARPPVTLATSLWTRYAADAAEREATNQRVGNALAMLNQGGNPQRLLMLGAAEGLEAHLMAVKGDAGFLAMDDRPDYVDLARRCIAKQKYTGGEARLRFEHHPDIRRIPLETGSMEAVIIQHLLDRHPNPVALLKEVARVLVPSGLIMVFGRRREKNPPDPSAGGPGVAGLTGMTGSARELSGSVEHRYLWFELASQIHSLRIFEMLVEGDQAGLADLTIACRRGPGEAAEMPQVAEMERRKSFPANNSRRPAAVPI